MKSYHLICVGKFKSPHFEELEMEFVKRLTHPKLIIHEVKAKAENKDFEAQEIEKKIKEIGESGAFLVAMSEWGKMMPSVEFSHWLADAFAQSQKLIFIIAGAEGFAPDFLKKCHFQLSLSPLTFPHRLARLCLIEQIYRAQTIRSGHPYHN
jgi:23S rRNA (pseudouridine1915-N3)-methyltransferase